MVIDGIGFEIVEGCQRFLSESHIFVGIHDFHAIFACRGGKGKNSAAELRMENSLFFDLFGMRIIGVGWLRFYLCWVVDMGLVSVRKVQLK
jgi:hypothetical protein